MPGMDKQMEDFLLQRKFTFDVLFISTVLILLSIILFFGL